MEKSVIDSAKSNGYSVEIKSAGRLGKRYYCKSERSDINILQCKGSFSLEFIRKSSYVFARPKDLYVVQTGSSRFCSTWRLHNFNGSECLTLEKS